MAEIKQLKEGDKYIYPLTSTKAIVDEEGKRLIPLTSEIVDEVTRPTDFMLTTSDIAQEVSDVENKAISPKAVKEAVSTKIVNQTESEVTIQPDVLNVWGVVESLDITFAEGADGVVNEYMIQFTSSDPATSLELPRDIKWKKSPVIEANKTYQISIVNNLAVIGGFANE